MKSLHFEKHLNMSLGKKAGKDNTEAVLLRVITLSHYKAIA